jgi:hypothetical protein
MKPATRALRKKPYLQAIALDTACVEAAVGLGLLYVERRQYKEGARLLGVAVEQGSRRRQFTLVLRRRAICLEIFPALDEDDIFRTMTHRLREGGAGDMRVRV